MHWIYLVVLYILLNTYYCFSNCKLFSIDIYTKMNIYIYIRKLAVWIIHQTAILQFIPPTLCLHPVFCCIVGDKIDDIEEVDDNDNN